MHRGVSLLAGRKRAGDPLTEVCLIRKRAGDPLNPRVKEVRLIRKRAGDPLKKVCLIRKRAGNPLKKVGSGVQ